MLGFLVWTNRWNDGERNHLRVRTLQAPLRNFFMKCRQLLVKSMPSSSGIDVACDVIISDTPPAYTNTGRKYDRYYIFVRQRSSFLALKILIRIIFIGHDLSESSPSQRNCGASLGLLITILLGSDQDTCDVGLVVMSHNVTDGNTS